MYFGIKGVPVDTLRELVRRVQGQYGAMVLLSPELEGRRYVRLDHTEAIKAVRTTLGRMHADIVEVDSLPGGKHLQAPRRASRVTHTRASAVGPKTAEALDEVLADMVRGTRSRRNP